MHNEHKNVNNSKEEFFIYKPQQAKNRNINKKINKNNLFNKLSELRFR